MRKAALLFPVVAGMLFPASASAAAPCAWNPTQRLAGLSGDADVTQLRPLDPTKPARFRVMVRSNSTDQCRPYTVAVRLRLKLKSGVLSVRSYRHAATGERMVKRTVTVGRCSLYRSVSVDMVVSGTGSAPFTADPAPHTKVVC